MSITGAGTCCIVEGCDKPVRSLGLCKPHYVMQRNYGRTDYRRVPSYKGESCKVDGCEEPIKARSLCRNHYSMRRKYGRTEKLERNKRAHPLYVTWFNHKHFGNLSSDWEEFWRFAADVGEKPKGNHVLYRSDKTMPYGPGNWEWRENLRRRPGETDQQWYKRKWASRHPKDSTLERERSLFRRYNMTIAEYEQALSDQSGLCAICRKPETSIDGKTNTVKRLAVDHNHITGVVRGLLCWRCNATIGKLDEDLDLLDAMRAYLVKYLEAADG